METITVSVLPNITFYSGKDAEEAASALENRLYGTNTTYFGELSLTRDNNSYWSLMPSNIFGENPTNYNNIGDIINATISYMGKFKNNLVDINVDKNILTFNYKYEEDLDSDFDNTFIIPSQKLIDLLLNVNDMRFNKLKYYKNNIELKEITYAHKKYPYNPIGTKYTVTEDNNIVEYDFSNQFVDYKYMETSYDVSYIGSYMRAITLADGTISYVPTGLTYEGFNTYYSYTISEVNRFDNRMDLFFENNTNRVVEEYDELKTYFISELDTVLTLNLNTYSLGGKNLYAYFNFDSKYNNWFNNIITFDVVTEGLEANSTIASIEPLNENYFNVNINTNKICGNDVKADEIIDFKIQNTDDLNEIQKFDIVNPSNIKGIDFGIISDKIKKVNLINAYDKKVNVYNTINTNWIIEGGSNLEYLRLGNLVKDCNIEEIYGISNFNSLKEIDITNCNHLKKDFSISKLNNLNIFKAIGSNIKNFVPKANSEFIYVSLPQSLKTLSLKNVKIDQFEYVPTANLINVTLNNVSGDGLNVQNFIKKWVDVLDSTQVEGKEITVLKDGIVTNTNLVGIDFHNYKVNDLLKFKYLGLNNFSGNISIIGQENNYISRKEYLQLRETFGDEIMQCGKYKNIPNSKPINFEYQTDPDMLNKDAYFYAKVVQKINDEEYNYLEPAMNESNEVAAIQFKMEDNKGGHSLLDFFDDTNRLLLKKNKEKFAYEITLPTKIYTDNDNTSSLTKQLTGGDVVIYKGNKLLLVFQTPRNNVYNYVRIGRFQIPNNSTDEIIISFNKLHLDNNGQIVED